MARQAFKPPKDPRGGHIRLYWDIFDSNAWACVAASSQLAYLALLRQKGSTNNGDLSLPISFARRYGITSEPTLAKALRELCAVGLIALTRKGGSTKDGHRIVNLYRLTDTEVYPNPVKFIEACKATNDWKAITTLGLGRDAIRKAEAAAAEAETARKTKRLLQKMKPTPSINEVVEPVTTSKNEAWPSRPLQEMKPVKEGKSPGKPMPERVSV